MANIMSQSGCPRRPCTNEIDDIDADTIKGGLRPPTMRDKIKDADADALADADTLNGSLRPPANRNKKSEHNGRYYVAEWISLKPNKNKIFSFHRTLQFC